MEVTEEKEIVDALRSQGLNEVAARLVQLIEMLDEDPDEPDLAIESLRSFAEFFMQEIHLPVPEIGAGPEGFVEAEWRISTNGEGIAPSDESYWGRGDGILAMKFLPTGLSPVRRNLRASRAGQRTTANQRHSTQERHSTRSSDLRFPLDCSMSGPPLPDQDKVARYCKP